MEVNEAKQLKRLDEENRRLKELVADLLLDNRRNAAEEKIRKVRNRDTDDFTPSMAFCA